MEYRLSLIADTSWDPSKTDIDFKKEDASFVLLRIMDAAALPQDKEAEREESWKRLKRISGETENIGMMQVRWTCEQKHSGFMGGFNVELLEHSFLEEMDTMVKLHLT